MPFWMILIVPALLAVAVADALLKQSSVDYTTFWTAATCRYTVMASVLYLFQVGAFLYAFLQKADLSTVAVLQTVLYAVITLGAAHFFFGEHLSASKLLWAAVAVIAVIGMNTSK